MASSWVHLLLLEPPPMYVERHFHLLLSEHPLSHPPSVPPDLLKGLLRGHGLLGRLVQTVDLTGLAGFGVGAEGRGYGVVVGWPWEVAEDGFFSLLVVQLDGLGVGAEGV